MAMSPVSPPGGQHPDEVPPASPGKAVRGISPYYPRRRDPRIVRLEEALSLAVRAVEGDAQPGVTANAGGTFTAEPSGLDGAEPGRLALEFGAMAEAAVERIRAARFTIGTVGREADERQTIGAGPAAFAPHASWA